MSHTGTVHIVLVFLHGNDGVYSRFKYVNFHINLQPCVCMCVPTCLRVCSEGLVLVHLPLVFFRQGLDGAASF